MIKLKDIAKETRITLEKLFSHLYRNILLVTVCSGVFSFFFCLLFISLDFDPFITVFIIHFIAFSFTVIITGLIFYNEIGIYINLLDLSASSNIRKILTQKQPYYSSLKKNAIFIASFFHKILSKLIQTEDSLYTESDTLQKISASLYNSSRYQQNSIAYVLSSSKKIDNLLTSTKNNIRSIEQNASETLESSSAIENNSFATHVLLDDLINYIQGAKDILKRSEYSFQDSNKIVENINRFTMNTTDTMEELKATAYSIHNNILKTIDFQKEVFKKVENSQSIINEYAESIGNIREHLSITLQIIDILKWHSEQINRILATINRISKQTNLLSLNANIIAASSPEETKSFAVVADEIQSLSKKTISSTSKIYQIISNIDKSISKSRDASQVSLNIVDQTQVFGKQVNKNLLSILDIARNSISNVETIKNSNVLQVNRIEQLLERTRLSSQKIAQLSNHNSRLQSEFQHLKDLSVQLIDITNALKGRMSIQLANTKSLINNTNSIGSLVNRIVDGSSSIKTQSNSILDSFSDVRHISEQVLYTVKDLTNISYQIHNEYNRMQSLTEYFVSFSPKRGGTINAYFPPFRADFSYDPASCSLIESVPLYKAIYETLVETESGFDVTPLLCEKYEISDDFSEYTFFLKENVYFHNMKKLKAEDVKFSFERLRDVLGSDAGHYIGSIEGWDEFFNHKADELKGIRVIDDYTVRIKLQKPLSFFLQVLSTVVMSIIPRAAGANIDMPAGTGAFKFARQSVNQYILLERFDKYHIEGFPFVDKVKFISKERNDIFSTDYHILPGHRLPNKNIFADINKLVNTDTELHCEILDPNSVSYLILNNQVYPFNIKEVRQAVMLCIDRDKMTDTVFNQINKKAESIIPQNLFAHLPRKDLVRYDIAAAEKLIRKSGIKTPIKLNYYSNIGLYQDPAAKFILDNISRLGIEIEYTFTDSKEFEDKKYESAINLMIWFADYPDPDNFFQTFTSDNIDNRSVGWINKKYIDLVSRARIETDMQKREKLYNMAQEIMLDDAVIIPLYYNKYFLFHHYDIICPTKTVFPFYDIKSCWFYSNKNKIK